MSLPNAVEIHLGALGLLPPYAPEPAAAAEPAPVQDPAPMALAPSTARWPISEAPASLNIKLKVGNMELMYTMRDVGLLPIGVLDIPDVIRSTRSS